MRKMAVLVLFFAFSFSLQAQAQQNVHLNKVIDKLEHHQIVIGTWVSALHPSNAIGLVEFNRYPDYKTSLSQPMLDFILIDMEHQPYDISVLRNFLLALNSKREVVTKGNLQPNIATFVRLPTEGGEPVHPLIKQVLDVGVYGVVIPHVQTAAEAEEIVSACRYRRPKGSPLYQPKGTRGASPWLAAYLWGLTLPEYVARADVWPLNPKGDLMAVIMIEDLEGVQNVDKILRVKGIGAVIFGPYDYSFACGHPGETTHPDVLKAQETVKKACDRAGVPLVGFGNPGNIRKLVQQGYRMFLVGHDVRPDGRLEKVLNILKNQSQK
jgi:4-hydroxy-2-oxoheptanedioate aldolase